MFALVKKVFGIKASPKHATLAVKSQVKAGRRGRGRGKDDAPNHG